MKTIISIDFDAKYQNRPPWISPGKPQFDIFPIVYFLKRFNKLTTIFVREDLETIEFFGLNYCCDRLYSIKNSFPVEFGWHPHVFSFTNHVIKEEQELLSNLEKILDQSSFAQKCRLVRIGSCQSGNSVMSFLSQNFDIDSSAMSQCVRQDSLRWYDWSTTYGNLYYPSIDDYRISGNLTHDILEIPITTMNVLAPYDKIPKKRILNPAINAAIFQKAVMNSITYLKSLDCLVVACHAEELEHGFSNDLYVYGLDNFFENLSFIENLFNCEYISFEDMKNNNLGVKK